MKSPIAEKNRGIIQSNNLCFNLLTGAFASSGRSRSYIKRTNTTDNSLDDLQKSDRNSASAQHSPLALGKSLKHSPT